MDSVKQLKNLYRLKRGEIKLRLGDFRKLWSQGGEEEIFTELIFCILTPQAKAKFCWDSVTKLGKKNLLLKGSAGQIRECLTNVRFRNKKSAYITEARRLFINNGRISIKPLLSKFNNVQECREWLVRNIKGLGYKEASHFLRNIGLGEKIAILDRHIVRNLKKLGIIDEIPKSLGRRKYRQIEEDMKEFADEIDIPLSHLDLLLWYKETGEIFK
ncbi:MAG: N-glycosylase/DNA lyase [Nitrospirota bacterium]